MPFFYLSFCDTKKPSGEQFLGATVVEAHDVHGAIPRAWQLGLNPGGEVAIVTLPFGCVNEIPQNGRKYLHTFVPREAVLSEPHIKQDDLDDEDMRDVTVCQTCNSEEPHEPTEKQRNALSAGHLVAKDGVLVSGLFHKNGKPMFSEDGTMLNENGTRSIFDDVDE